MKRKQGMVMASWVQDVPSAPVGHLATGMVGDTTLKRAYETTAGTFQKFDPNFNPEEDCWERGYPARRTSTKSSATIRDYSADAKYLASIRTTFSNPSMNNPSKILRMKTVNDFNKFMMQHPWRKKGLDDMEEENKRAYDASYIDNPQHVADKRAFEEAEARVANKNSILKAVMTDPGLALLDYENKEPDQVDLLRKSNQSFVSSRDKYFIPPRPTGERAGGSDSLNTIIEAQQEEAIREMNRYANTTEDPLGTR